jgi:DUF4097 and DUF4098 domain-containing protein YvlB
VRLPRGASVAVKNVGGDMALKSVTGDVALNEIHGDLSIRDVDNISIETVHADLSLRGAKGNVSVKSVHGDASIRDVGGNIALDSVSDDLALRDARGNIIANVGEDVVLYLNPQTGKAYSVTAGEDILLVMPPSANASLTLSGDEIDIDWKGVENEEDATSRILVLGDGSATVTLNAGGDIRVSNQSDAGDSAEDFGNFAGIGFDWSGFGDRISRKVEDATRRATKRADEAVRRAERHARAAEHRVRSGVNVGRWNWDLTPKGAPIPPKEPVSDAERMAILKMLQEKKITTEEAEKLLASLEGGS